MKRLFLICSAFLVSCTNRPSQQAIAMEDHAEILVSQSQGGSGNIGYTMLTNEQDFQKAINGNSEGLVISLDSAVKTTSNIQFPKNKKVILYNLGSFRAGNHQVNTIEKVYVENDILYVEVPYVKPDEMEVQVLSKPFVIFTVPSNYKFNSIEFKSIIPKNE